MRCGHYATTGTLGTKRGQSTYYALSEGTSQNNKERGIKMSEYYAYAQGYYDGRVIGVEQDLPDMARMSSICRSRYKEGYERGVADYCESGGE
jgi:hypothetical protein